MEVRKLFALFLALALSLSLLTACGGNNNGTKKAAPGAALMSDALDMSITSEDAQNHSAFGSPSLKRSQIQSVTFLSNTRQAPDESWDVSEIGDASALAWAVGSGDLYDLYIAGENGLTAPENCAGLFYGYSNLTTITFKKLFDTSHVTDMGMMFFNCSGLTALDVSGFDTSHVTNMYGMFCSCSGLTTLDVSGFDTSNVTNMGGMFIGCSNLTSLDVSGFDTSNVTRMSQMFTGCSSLKSLDVSGFDTSNVTNIGWMFTGCPAVTKDDVSGWNLSNATDAARMF